MAFDQPPFMHTSMIQRENSVDKGFEAHCFHPLSTDVERPQQLNNPFNYRPHPLALLAADQLQRYVASQLAWQEEIALGKMFGVLVVEDAQHSLGYLAAYSGQIGGRSNWHGFVPAVFDYLEPQGYFKKQEAFITQINARVKCLEVDEEYQKLKTKLKEYDQKTAAQLTLFQEEMKVAKKRRDQQRRELTLSVEQQAALIKESQFMKAEYKRLKERLRIERIPLLQLLAEHEQQMEDAKALRRTLSDELQRWLFSHFVMLNAKGEQRNLLTIFAQTSQGVPPAGAGECCAPKLLQYAYLHRLKPVCIAEFWWGASPKTSVRHHGQFYPACRGKCLPILSFMLQGLKVDAEQSVEEQHSQLHVVYEDDALIVVDKPAGILSVPGRSLRPSVYSILRSQMPSSVELFSVHRLDMATSGLLILAKNSVVYRHLQRQFRTHHIQKEYIAILEGSLSQRKGVVTLPLRPDPFDRPRQVVDWEHGKKAVTSYRVLGVRQGKTWVALFPETGRTHQLRMHCAHAEGLNCPILGDPLYGHHANRLYLHATSITFVHPISGQLLTLHAQPPAVFQDVFMGRKQG